MISKGSIRINVGGTSIIVIWLVIILTTFGVLSTRTSYHELKLSEKTVANIQEYYIADSKAAEMLMELNELLFQQQWNGTNEHLNELLILNKKMGEKNTVSLQDGIIIYEVTMNSASTIKVEVFPEIRDSQPYLSVLSWKMVTQEQGEYNSGEIEIWDGQFSE